MSATAPPVKCPRGPGREPHPAAAARQEPGPPEAGRQEPGPAEAARRELVGRGDPEGACTVIQPVGSDLMSELRELWRYRELLGFLAWRDLRVRYRQTLLGAAWALFEPLVSVVLFTLVFHNLAGLSAGSVPYPLHCYAGVAVWTFFGRALRSTTVSLVANANLVTKAYFPRLILPLSGQLATLVDLACALLMYAGLVLYYGVTPSAAVFTVPLWVALAGLSALGVGLVLAAINVRFRDVSQAVPFLVQMWMLATPVAYPLATIPAVWRPLYGLNPMVGAVEGMRWALLPGYHLDTYYLIPSVTLGLTALLVGSVWFRGAQRRFADIV